MSSIWAPASISSATARSVPARVLEWRNQPVSMAIAVSRPVATSGVSEPPSARMARMTRIPVASAVESLKKVAPRSSWLTWWSMTTRRPGKPADELGHVAKLVPRRQVEDDRDFAIGQLPGLDARCRSARRASHPGRESRSEGASGWRSPRARPCPSGAAARPCRLPSPGHRHQAGRASSPGNGRASRSGRPAVPSRSSCPVPLDCLESDQMGPARGLESVVPCRQQLTKSSGASSVPTWAGLATRAAQVA